MGAGSRHRIRPVGHQPGAAPAVLLRICPVGDRAGGRSDHTDRVGGAVPEDPGQYGMKKVLGF